MGRGDLAKTQEQTAKGESVKYHTPALLQEIIQFLDPKPDKRIIDATIGGGGHTFEILERGAKVLGIDSDPDAIEHVRNQFQISTRPRPSRDEVGNFKFQIGKGLILVRGNFNKIDEIARSKGFQQVDGILFDLGVSSHQLEMPQRGFSFEKNGPLDMRTDPNLSISAYDLVNNFDQRRLNEILKTYGQEKLSWSIAGAICSARQIKTIETTGELAQIVKEVYGRFRKKGKLNQATKTFQALRIVVNSELLNLKEALPQTLDLLKTGGRLVIVSFHSLEDAIVKRFFKYEPKLKVLTPKPIGPKDLEIKANPRSRSAKLRAAEKI